MSWENDHAVLIEQRVYKGDHYDSVYYADGREISLSRWQMYTEVLNLPWTTRPDPRTGQCNF